MGVGRGAAGGRGHGGLARSCPRPRDLEGRATLFKVIETAPFPEQSVALLLAIEVTTRAPAFLMPPRAPRDFWINLRLGMLLLEVGGPAEAVGYSDRAGHPPGDGAPTTISVPLTRTNRSVEAIGFALDPSGGAGRLNLALDLWNLGRKDEAIRSTLGGHPPQSQLGRRSTPSWAGPRAQQPARRGASTGSGSFTTCVYCTATWSLRR